jgi:hypothetical protein
MNKSSAEIQRQKNIDSVKMEIFYKNRNEPYIVEKSIYNVQNDMDVFPYPRWFQGVPTDDRPIVSEREAGWTPKNILHNRDKTEKKKDPLKPANLCFQTACSVVYPCYAQDNAYIGINRACINEYR